LGASQRKSVSLSTGYFFLDGTFLFVWTIVQENRSILFGFLVVRPALMADFPTSSDAIFVKQKTD